MARKLKLTDTAIARLPHAEDKGKTVIYRDTELKGFGVMVSGTTGSAVYVCWHGTKIPRRTIGRCDLIKVKDARDTATEWMLLMKRGIDPRPKKEEAKPTNVAVKDLFERYLTDKKNLRPASINLYRMIFDHHLKPWLDKNISEITPEMVVERHTAIFKTVQKRNDPRSDGKHIADLSLKLFRAVFNFARAIELPGLPATCPVSRLDATSGWYLDAPVKRKGHVAEADLPRFWRCLDKLGDRQAMLVKLLLLTGLRVGVTKRLQWKEHVDLDANVIQIPGAMMKGRRDHALPIVPALHDMLAAYRKKLGIEPSGFVFPSSHHGKFLASTQPAFEAINQALGLHLSPHDLRRTFARAGKRAGVNKWIVAALLAHSGNSETDDYSGIDTADDLREPLERVTGYILARCGQNIIAMPTKPRRKAA